MSSKLDERISDGYDQLKLEFCYFDYFQALKTYS